MPRRLRRCRPAARAKAVSSRGVTNCSQRWVPGSSQRSTYSAPTIASAKLLSVRLRVEASRRPPGLTREAAAATKALRIGRVLDHLHRAHDIEPARLVRQLLDRAHAIGEPRARLLGVSARGFDRGGGRIEADHVRAEPRQRLGEQSGPAADVEEVDARERQAGRGLKPEMAGDEIARPGDPDRVQPMQGRHRPVRVPPRLAQRVEARDLGGHDAWRRPG